LSIVKAFVELKGSAFRKSVVAEDQGGSLSYARRLGASLSSGDVVVFLDGDMALTQGFFPALLSRIAGTDLLAPGMEVVALGDATRAFRAFLKMFDLVSSGVGGGGVVPQVRVYTAEALRVMGGYPLLSRFFAEDRLATAYALRLGLRYSYEPGVTLLKLDRPTYMNYLSKHYRYGKGIHTDLTPAGRILLRDYLLLRRLAYVDLPLPVATTLYFATRPRERDGSARLSRIIVIKWLLDFGMLVGEIWGSLSRRGMAQAPLS
jgi:glycosyltransferase involved in cell wall biosynthesis